jgi:hypothetical protein
MGWQTFITHFLPQAMLTVLFVGTCAGVITELYMERKEERHAKQMHGDYEG